MESNRIFQGILVNDARSLIDRLCRKIEIGIMNILTVERVRIMVNLLLIFPILNLFQKLSFDGIGVEGECSGSLPSPRKE